MKRLLLAAALALGLHALVLSAKVEWIRDEPLAPAAPPIRLSLSYRSPEPEPAAPPPIVKSHPKAPSAPAPKEVKEVKKTPVPEKRQPLPKKTPSPELHEEAPPPEMREALEPAETASLPEEETREPSAEVAPPSPMPPPSRSPSSSDAAPSFPAHPRSEGEAPPSRQAVPLYLKNPPPQYPAAARRRGYEGTVRVEVLVDREGKVRDLRLVESSGHPMLDRAAIGTVKGWRFEPARRGEEKVEMWVTVPVTFRLKDKDRN